MPSAGFEPAIPASDRLLTHALDRSATGNWFLLQFWNQGVACSCLFQGLKTSQHIETGSQHNNNNTMYVQRDTEARSRIIFAVEKSIIFCVCVRARACACARSRGRVYARAFM